MRKHYFLWKEMYEYAKMYFLKHGDLEVPCNFKTSDGYTYDPNGNIKLGMWIKNQRQTCDFGTDCYQLLLDIGMRFDKIRNTLKWEEMYEYAKMYFLKHGDLEVPTRFRTNDGYTYDADGNIKLGMWIKNQRQTCDFDTDFYQLLLDIGMRFDKIRNTLKWEEMYEYAKKFFKKYGNLQIPQSFRTNDGYTYDSNGIINLGTWISTQRQYCNPKSMRGYLLDCIGMIWDIHKNKFDILCFCHDNSIDIEKNKDVLKHISLLELEVKYQFLKERKIPFIKDELLHEVFSMSSLNMKAKYGITLEDLIKIYDKDRIL